MSKNSTAKIIKIIKKDYKRKLVKDIEAFLKKKNKTSDNMVVNNTKIYQKMINKSWLSIEKKYHEMRKNALLNYKKLFSFRKFDFSWG